MKTEIHRSEMNIVSERTSRNGVPSTPYRCRPVRGWLGFVVDSPRELLPAWHINPQISQIRKEGATEAACSSLQSASIGVHLRIRFSLGGFWGRLTHFGWGLREAEERCAQHTLPLSPRLCTDQSSSPVLLRGPSWWDHSPQRFREHRAERPPLISVSSVSPWSFRGRLTCLGGR